MNKTLLELVSCSTAIKSAKVILSELFSGMYSMRYDRKEYLCHLIDNTMIDLDNIITYLDKDIKEYMKNMDK